MIDLHAHTTASDGLLPPERLVELAVASGVRVLAITDHETTAGIAAAREAAAGRIRIVPGVEISCRWNGREIHVLGHFVAPEDEGLERRLAAFRASRSERMEAMVERLRARGLGVTMDEVEAQREGEGSLGRPHLARVLVARGWARDVQDAFDRWIGKGTPGWVERPLPDAVEAIRWIREAGGCAVVAHPGASHLGEREIRGLAAAGLEGIEVDHPSHTQDLRNMLRRVAAKLDLCATAGSDFHTEEAGVLPGSEGMDPGEFARLESRVPGRQEPARG